MRNRLLAILVFVFLLLSVVNPATISSVGKLTSTAYWRWQTRDLRTVSDSATEVRVAVDSIQGVEIAKAVDRWLGEISDLFGQSVAPPLVLVFDLEDLNNRIGGNYSLETAGAYQHGVVFLGADSQGKVSDSLIVHELAHHFVNELSRGNYPVWYSEGLAQMAEYMLLEYRWFDAVSNYHYYRYSTRLLEGNFFGLESQVSAYRRALELVLSIDAIDGQAHQKILKELAQGVGFEQTIIKTIGITLSELDRKHQTERGG